MEESRRRLPHVYPEGRWLFLTWHLHGSLPQRAYPPPGHLNSGQAFAWMDRCLDSARYGPSYLSQGDVAGIVLNALSRGRELGHFDLGPYVLMPNHVHVLLLPKVSPPQLLRSVKGVSAREANGVLGLSGNAFWQRESYDHWVRSESEWKRIAAYIANNPVRAGLAQCAEDYPWSSAGCTTPEELAPDGGRSAATAR
jgi:REP element-mobilizing transposase RayT